MPKPTLSRRREGALGVKSKVAEKPNDGLQPPDDQSVVDKFLAEHPEPIADPPEGAPAPPPIGEDGPVEEPPKEDAPVVEAPPAPPVEGAKPADKPSVEPPKPKVEEPPKVEGAKPVEKPVETPAPKPTVFDPNEKFALAPDAEWTREQIITRLQQYQQMAPQAEKDGALLKSIGGYEHVEKNIAPLLHRLATRPDQQQFFDQVLDADPDTIAYLVSSINFYNEKMVEMGKRPASEEKPAQQPVDVTKDPRVAEALAYIERQKVQAGNDRARREYTDAFAKYPFLQTDNAALEGLKSLANALYNEDKAKGIDDLDCRGISAAVEANKAMYDARMIVLRQENAPPAPPAEQPNADGAKAILGSAGTSPTGQKKRVQDYRGDPEDAVAAFVQEFPS